MSLQAKFSDAIWVANALFNRNVVNGSAANLSFRNQDRIYITRSGASFGRLTPEDFSVVDLNGSVQSGEKPSKELPLHLTLYSANSQRHAVIHTHSLYATLWSMTRPDDDNDSLSGFTPYLSMHVGKVPIVPFFNPGSSELFAAFGNRCNSLQDAYLLKRHGPILSGTDLMNAFNRIEELEYTAKVAWLYSNK